MQPQRATPIRAQPESLTAPRREQMCPTCGLLNPPGASFCDCGYDFNARKPADVPGWPIISLAWRQKVAAYWSISWPAWIGFCALGVSSPPYLAYYLLAFFGIQAILCRRLVRKNYESFRVYVIREDGGKGRSLSMAEGLVIWLWIFAPQFAFFVIFNMGAEQASKFLPDMMVVLLLPLLFLLLFLAVGPYAVGLAMRRGYHAFRLQAYSLRYL
jgi:hypothetical protein